MLDVSAHGPEAIDTVATTTKALHDMITTVLGRLPELIAGAVVFVLFVALAHALRWGTVRATRKSHRSNIGLVLGRLGYFGMMLLGILVALTVVAPSMTPARLVSMLGIGGLALGFAFKDLFQNLVAGILLLWREPFRLGDEITSDKWTGVVEVIDTRATFIKTYDGKRVIIPNSQIYTTTISVITAYENVRSEYDVGVGYGDDLAKAKSILMEILGSVEGVLESPAPDVLVWDLAGSTVNLRARWWSKPNRANVVKVRDRVLHQMRDRLTAAGIDLPFPTQVVLFHDQTEETDGDRTRQREGWPAGDPPPKALRDGSPVSVAKPASSDGDSGARHRSPLS